jgi:hypothetical protein
MDKDWNEELLEGSVCKGRSILEQAEIRPRLETRTFEI